MKRINNGWEFVSKWSKDFLEGGPAEETVRIPHTVKELPLHYADHESYQGIYGYRRTLRIAKSQKGKRLFVQFDGAAHIATVYCNGKKLLTHRCGYTGFRAEITDSVQYGADNVIALRLDTTENGSVPPFGFVIDYLTYGGIYRDVWLDERPDLFIENIYAAPTGLHALKVQVHLSGAVGDETVAVSINNRDQELAAGETKAADDCELTLKAPAAKPWTPETPVLYCCTVELRRDGKVIDCVKQQIGFRTVAFNENEFLLNGKPYFLRGLNRHQSYPYIGYAATKSLQEDDARILKDELHCNAVRTSHYPQSRYFLDACDRLGLLVFTEMPGWQHIGDEAWKEQAIENCREMILEDRNHPSVFLWGVRINESQDDDAFYQKTNALAHALDPYRPTSGVRYLEKSHLLEDVYAYNDFSHMGTNPGARRKKDVTTHLDKPVIISESNGHMFPTKAFDTWQRRQEHALRHARVLDAAMADHAHAGCFQWCMFDYATHRDFGSGDRICYHGVMDSFRNPKMAAAVYASQQDKVPVLEIGSPMDIGDYPAGQIGKIYAFTNADEVALYKNDSYVASFQPKGWNGLKHGPIEIDDMIGCLLETQEGFNHSKAELIHKCLLDAVKFGPSNLPNKTKAALAYAMMKYKLSYADGVSLFGKYVGNWGGEAVRWRFDACKGGKVVASVLKTPSCRLHLEVRPSSLTLREGETYDMAAVRIRVLDENGNLASYAQLPISFALSGPAELIGPSEAAAEGGMTGTYLKTSGEKGRAVLTITSPQTESVQLIFNITGEDDSNE
jgi:beta-galactosidase